MEFYLVGGAVRDRLLGIEPLERDWVVVGATPAALGARGFRRKDAEFPVFANPESGEEYALARRETKSAAGHKGFALEFGPDVTLEEDLRRRDLRVNAIAQTESGEIVDPFDGRADLEARVLRHVSPAFVEDPLRVLRAARFAARLDHLGFSIHPSTAALMRSMSDTKDMRALSASRVWAETNKALATARPARYFAELDACGALKTLFPELARAIGNSPEPPPKEKPRWMDVLDAAAEIEPRAEIRFAALVAGLQATGGAQAGELLDGICGRFPIPRRYADLATVAADVAAGSDFTDGNRSVLALLEKTDAFRRSERFRDALSVCRALETASVPVLPPGTSARLARALEAALAVSGAEVSQAGFEGKDIASELTRRRLRAIEETLASGG